MLHPAHFQRIAGIAIIGLAAGVFLADAPRLLKSAPSSAWSLHGGGNCYQDGTANCNDTKNCVTSCPGPGTCPGDGDYGYEDKTYDKATGGHSTGQVSTTNGSTTCARYWCTSTCQLVSASWLCYSSTFHIDNQNVTTSTASGGADPGG